MYFFFYRILNKITVSCPIPNYLCLIESEITYIKTYGKLIVKTGLVVKTLRNILKKYANHSHRIYQIILVGV